MWKAYGESRDLPAGPSARYLRSADRPEGGHLVRFSDGRAVRVLPDGLTSGQRRSRMISAALGELESGQLDPVAYFAARLGDLAVLEPADGTEEGEL